MNYGGNMRNTLENLMMMSRAEGQDIVNELVANKDNRILDCDVFRCRAAARIRFQDRSEDASHGRRGVSAAVLGARFISRPARTI